MTAAWCFCGLHWLLRYQHSLIEGVHRHTREGCHALNLTT